MVMLPSTTALQRPSTPVSIVIAMGSLLFALGDELRNRMQDLIGPKRLYDPRLGAGHLPRLLALLARFGGEHDDRHETVMRQLLDLFHEGDAVHSRHVNVTDHQIDLAAIQLLQSFGSVYCIEHFLAGVRQRSTHGFP